MNLRQIPTPKIILTIILALFVVKGAFLSLLIPLFQNPDEPVHYGTVQHWAEPKEKSWEMRSYESEKYAINPNDIRTTNLPEETVRSAFLAGFDEVKFEKQNIQNFSTSTTEQEIRTNNWKRYVDTSPSAVSGTTSVYYLLASWGERLFSHNSIFTRVFMARMLAVILGFGVILLSYATTKKIGFSERNSLLFTAIVAFQPMFSITAAQVNIDIALVFAFSLFFYVGVVLLKDGLTWRRALFAIGAALLGFFSKGPGALLILVLYPLFVFGAYEKLHVPVKKFLVSLILITIVLSGVAFLVIPGSYIVSITNSSAQSKFSSPIKSLSKYLDKTIRGSELRDTALSYWGNFGWLDSSISDWELSIIRLIEVIGFVGTIWYLLSHHQLSYLPEKKYLVFFLGLIIALELAIRFYDWRVFDYTEQILIGQPGRYFLPNLIGHLIIVITGIGFLLRQESLFTLTLKAMALAMILLQMNAIINVIIPRYYL